MNDITITASTARVAAWALLENYQSMTKLAQREVASKMRSWILELGQTDIAKEIV